MHNTDYHCIIIVCEIVTVSEQSQMVQMHLNVCQYGLINKVHHSSGRTGSRVGHRLNVYSDRQFLLLPVTVVCIWPVWAGNINLNVVKYGILRIDPIQTNHHSVG